MRITFRMRSGNTLHDLLSIQNRLDRSHRELTSGKRILSPSDDPPGTTTSLELDKDLDTLEQYQKNLKYADGWVSMTDLGLQGTLDILNRVKALSIQGANDTNNEENRDIIANEINQLLELMVQTGNTRYMGKYIFGGTETLTTPFEGEHGNIENINSTGVNPETFNLSPPARILPGTILIDGNSSYIEGVDYTIDYDANTITILTGSSIPAGAHSIDYDTEYFNVLYNGNSGHVLREIDSDDRQQVNLIGSEVWMLTENSFQALMNARDALYANDSSSLETYIGEIDRAFKQVDSYNSVQGIRMRKMDLTDSNLETRKVKQTELFASFLDADIPKVITEYQLQQTAYQIALQVSSNIMRMSLFNFI